jgi:putative ABC transport system permease protein
MLKDYFRFAYTSVRQRKLRTWLTMIGIFIGIAAVVALISLSSGLRAAVADQFVSLGSDKVVVQAAGGGFGPPGTAVIEPLTTTDKKTIEQVQGVDLALGRLIRIVQLEYKDEVKYAYAVSVPDDSEERELVVEVNQYNIAQGKFIEKDDAQHVVLGSHINDDFFEEDIELRDTLLIQGYEFEVVGLLAESGNPQQDHTFVLPEKTMRTILNIEEDFDIIPVKVAAGEDLDKVSDSIAKELRKTHNVEEGKEDFTIQTPQQIIATLNTILLIIQGVLVGIAAISLVVGGIGIMNTMYTAVVERTKEIGILKAVGATNKKILWLFLIESGMLGLFGGVIGVSFGMAIAKMVEWAAFQQLGSPLLQASFPISLIVGMLLFAFVVGAVSGVLPARQAAKLKPVEALRK